VAAYEETSEAGDVVVEVDALLSLTRDCFEQLGVPGDDAQIVADVLIDANLHGIPSHGVQRVPIFMQRVRAGLAGGTEHISITVESGPLCRMDAGQALGPAASVKAVDHALALARRFGMGLVAIGGSTHFGAAGYYARRAAHAGSVGIVMANAYKRMAPYGAEDVFLGTNPLAIGIPLANHDPFVLDMATSMAAQGRITRARELDEELPDGLAVDAQGRPTTDPAAALAGSLLPMGGPKGSGLALAISLLAVLFAGADSDDQMASFYKDFDRPQNAGHIFIAIEASRLGDPGQRLDAIIERLVALRPVNGASAVHYPGEVGARLARARRQSGIPVSPAEILDIAETCGAFGLDDLQRRALALLAR